MFTQNKFDEPRGSCHHDVLNRLRLHPPTTGDVLDEGNRNDAIVARQARKRNPNRPCKARRGVELAQHKGVEPGVVPVQEKRTRDWVRQPISHGKGGIHGASSTFIMRGAFNTQYLTFAFIFTYNQVYTPTWETNLCLPEKRDGLMKATYTAVEVVPILVPPDNVSARYSESIFPDHNLGADDHLQRAKLQIWPRSGTVCKTLSHPIKDGIKYPHGSLLDTQACPFWCINPLCLQQYLQVRGFHLRQKEKVRTLKRLFKRAVRQDRLPFTLDQWEEYRQRPQYYSATPFTPVANTLKKDNASVAEFIKSMSVSEESVHKTFAAPNEVYKRALRRLRDGHIDVSSLNVCIFVFFACMCVFFA